MKCFDKYVKSQENRKKYSLNFKIYQWPPTSAPQPYIFHPVYDLITSFHRPTTTTTEIPTITPYISDKSNKMDLALLTLMYQTTNEYQIMCYTRDADGNLKEISKAWFMGDQSKFNFPVRYEFVAMMVFYFEREKPIQVGL
uniref:Uncharacterized protein n=1 Tax=Romanomermis culicivorax TaxID=13658 RepID=A0A915IP13_ROMCU